MISCLLSQQKRIKQTNLLQLQIEQDTLRKKCDLRMEHYEHFHTPNLWIKIYHYLKRTDHKVNIEYIM